MAVRGLETEGDEWMVSVSLNFNKHLMDRRAERTEAAEGVWFPMSLTTADWWPDFPCLCFLPPCHICFLCTALSANMNGNICRGDNGNLFQAWERGGLGNRQGFTAQLRFINLCLSLRWSGGRRMHTWEMSWVKTTEKETNFKLEQCLETESLHLSLRPGSVAAFVFTNSTGILSFQFQWF